MKERFLQIIDMCKERKVSVNELVEKLNVSPATVRRDLVEMEDKKLITRFHGYIQVNEENFVEPNMHFKELEKVKEKEMIAKAASYLIENGSTVFIDGGTTTTRIIDYIFAKNVTIVTHSLTAANKCSERGINCFVLGGYLRHKTDVFIGNEAIEKIKSLSFNISFIAANGVHQLAGFTSSGEMEGLLKKAVIESSVNSFICFDSSKINQMKMEKFADIASSNIITDSKVDGFDYSLFKKVIIANK